MVVPAVLLPVLMERQDQIQYFQQQLQQVVVLDSDTIMLTQLQEMVVLVQVHQVVHLELDRLVIPLQQLPHKVKTEELVFLTQEPLFQIDLEVVEVELVVLGVMGHQERVVHQGVQHLQKLLDQELTILKEEKEHVEMLHQDPT